MKFGIKEPDFVLSPGERGVGSGRRHVKNSQIAGRKYPQGVEIEISRL
jgi:hypothetical protein